MNADTTIVTCYYDIRKAENDPRCNYDHVTPPELYMNSIKTILELSYPVVIFTESCFEDLFWSIRPKEYQQYTKIIIKTYEEMSHYDKLEKLKENYVKNPVKNVSPIKFTPLYNFLIFHKTEFMKESIQNNYFNTERFAWFDVKAITFIQWNTLLHNKLNKFSDIFNNFLRDKVTIIEMAFTSKNELNEYYYEYTRGKVAATFFGGYKEKLLFFANAVEKEFLKTIEEGKCVAEEQIYGWIAGEYPDLFDPIFGDYGSHFLNNFAIRKDINLAINYLYKSFENGCHYKSSKCAKILANTVETENFIPDTKKLLFDIYNIGYVSNYYMGDRYMCERFVFDLLKIMEKDTGLVETVKMMGDYFKINTSYLNNSEIDSKIQSILYCK